LRSSLTIGVRSVIAMLGEWNGEGRVVVQAEVSFPM
jgi:hypothetical protein